MQPWTHEKSSRVYRLENAAVRSAKTVVSAILTGSSKNENHAVPSGYIFTYNNMLDSTAVYVSTVDRHAAGARTLS